MINLDGLVVTFDAGKSPVDENTPIKVKCTVGNVQPVVVSLGEVYILSGSPETIILNHGIEQVDPITLFKTIDDVKKEINKNTYLKIITDYDVVNKVYTYQVKIYLNGVGYDIDAVSDLDVVFNSQISSPSALGFQDEVDKGQTYPIIYAVTDSDILNVAKLAEAGKPNFVEKQGETILSVTIDKTTAYLKVVTDTSAFKFTTDQNKTTFDENKKDLKLSELISLTHLSSDENVTPSLEKVVKILNVKAISYGDGALIVDPSDDLSSWTLKKQIDNAGQIAYEPVLNITNNANDGWSFSKTNAHISLTISFDVQTIAGTKSIQLTLRSSVSIAVTDSWNNNRIFYARTKVQLLDDKGQDTYAVFRVTKEAGVTDDVSFQVNNSSSYISDSEGVVFEVTDSHIGSAQVQVLLNGVQIARFDFVVKPNVVATLKQDVVLESERTLANGNAYSISDLYDLSAYRTDITYGSASENLYIAANATETPTDLSISINTTNNDNPKLTYDTKLEVGPMVEINPDQDPIRAMPSRHMKRQL